MRWLLLLGWTTCCMAQVSRPPPVIPLGTSPKEVEIYTESHGYARFTSSDAILIGMVTSSTSQVRQSPAEILLEETCTLRIEAMYGRMPDLAGATSVRFHTSDEHDKYQQLEPDWGTYRHLREGQRVVVLLNDRDGPEICIHGLIMIHEAAKTLPDILRRTGCDASRFTSADLAVLNAASPLFYDEVVVIADVMASLRSDEAAFLNRLVGVCMALFFGGILCVDCARRQQLSAQKPTT
ncbi:MAG: hypothetical protein K9N47_13765 [Prosthecobacter sp.]|uniref:hypothetical protein n=1 Tax=Prosthecobacter sp. TaxID=1965333 RepID=UPI0025DEA619|nr:hypothetical protein [Prosthecobacter sp.]MCF7787189.1 hypothetical protein [Prosthecobacter sp.]